MNKVYALGDIVRKTTPTDTKYVSLPDTLEYNSSGVLVGTYNSGGPVLGSERSSSIVYSRRSKSKAHARRSNICVHSKHVTYSAGYPGPFPALESSRLLAPHIGWPYKQWWWYPTAYAAHTAALTAASAAFPSRGLGKLQANWESYAAAGFQAVQPDLTKVSVPNFLIDIGQIGDLGADIAPFITRTSAGQRQVFNDLIKVGTTTRKEQAKSAAKFVAGKRLSYKFGWKPTVGDLQAMVGSVFALQQRLQAFKESVGKELSFTKTLENVSSGLNGTFNYLGDVHLKVEWWGTLIGKVQYHARYQPQALACIGPLDEKIRGFLDTLGFELNPQIAWDAIPFSFVLDWFLGVGDWLSQFKIDALHLPILLVDSSVDYKETYEVVSKLTVNPTGTNNDSSNPVNPAGYITRDTLFHRMPVDPSLTILKSLKWKNPTGSQWTNFVSLATVLSL